MDERFKKQHRIRKAPLLAIVFFGWALCTSLYGVFAKVFLQETPLPVLLTTAQALFGTIGSMLIMTISSKSMDPIHSAIQSTKNRERVIFGSLVAVHYIATLTTNVGQITLASSFVNTLKAADPLFAVWGAKYVLNQKLTKLTLLSLVLIVAGIFVACTTEFDFAVTGFLISIFSNALFCARTIIVKKIQTEPKSMDYITVLFFMSSTCLFCCGLPLIYEAIFSNHLLSKIPFTPLILASLLHFVYSTLGFYLLSEVEALTYSVGTSMKRLVAIYFSLIYFQNKVSAENVIAALVAVGGAILYAIDRHLVARHKPVSGQKIIV